MSILTLSLVSHFVAFQFKPLNIFKATTTTQTVESVARMKQEAIQIIYRRQA